VSDLPAYPEAAAEREAEQGPPEDSRTYASWGRRAAANVLDGLIVAGIVVAAGALAFGVAALNEDAGLILFIVVLVGLIAFPVWYYTYFVGKTGQTWARRWLGIQVQDVTGGNAIGYGRAFGRYLITFIFGIFYIPLLLDYLWPLWDKQNQTLHDKVASSVVVRL
jgi:uncharacterized RDD family membrane protein YckC